MSDVWTGYLDASRMDAYHLDECRLNSEYLNARHLDVMRIISGFLMHLIYLTIYIRDTYPKEALISLTI